MQKLGQSKRKKVEVYYIGVQNFLWLLELWHTQQICWRKFVSCIHYLLHPAITKNEGFLSI